MCDILIETNQIYGCGKPFQIIIKDDGTLIVQKCDYIWKLFLTVFQWNSFFFLIYNGFSKKFIFFNIIHIYIYI